jgi:hypothetical protein
MAGFFSEESLAAIHEMLYAEATPPAPDTKSCQKKKPDIQKPVQPKQAQTAPPAPKPQQPQPQQPQQPKKVEPKKPPCPETPAKPAI